MIKCVTKIDFNKENDVFNGILPSQTKPYVYQNACIYIQSPVFRLESILKGVIYGMVWTLI